MTTPMPDVFDGMFWALMTTMVRLGPGDYVFRAAPDAYDAIQAAAHRRWKMPDGALLLEFQGCSIEQDAGLAPGIVYAKPQGP